jgi:hypothetical protein
MYPEQAEAIQIDAVVDIAETGAKRFSRKLLLPDQPVFIDLSDSARKTGLQRIPVLLWNQYDNPPASGFLRVVTKEHDSLASFEWVHDAEPAGL